MGVEIGLLPVANSSSGPYAAPIKYIAKKGCIKVALKRHPELVSDPFIIIIDAETSSA